MKIIVLLGNDIHSATAINLIFPALKKHEVKIILSKKDAKLESAGQELIEMKKCEEDRMEEMFLKLDGVVENSEKFRTFNQIANFFKTEVKIYDDINSEEALQDFQEFGPDLMISIRFRHILKKPLIKLPKKGVLNLHSGLLPQFRGVLASFWMILNGKKKLNMTLHFITDANIDTGDVVAFSEKMVDFDESLITNINQLYKDGCALIENTLEKIEEGKDIPLIKQEYLGSGKYFSFPKEDDVKKFLKIMPLVKDGDVEKILGNWS